MFKVFISARIYTVVGTDKINYRITEQRETLSGIVAPLLGDGLRSVRSRCNKAWVSARASVRTDGDLPEESKT